MKRFVLFVALSAMSIASVQAAFAQTFSMKGVLRDPLGRTVDDGQYQLTFKLYDAATGGGDDAPKKKNYVCTRLNYGLRC